jgi:hypothetical protein
MPSGLIPNLIGAQIGWLARWLFFIDPDFRQALIVAVDALHTLVAFLCMQAKRGNGPRLKASQINRLVSFDAIAIAAIFNTPQCRLDFLQ